MVFCGEDSEKGEAAGFSDFLRRVETKLGNAIMKAWDSQSMESERLSRASKLLSTEDSVV